MGNQMIQIIVTGKDKERFMGIFDNDREYRAIGRKLDKLEDSMTALAALIVKQGKDNMATKAEVKADLDEIKQIVGETRGVAKSIIILVDKLLERIANSAANATDLDAFRADLALIRTETIAERDEIAAKVLENPTT